MIPAPRPIHPVCPCGSESFRSIDTIVATCDIDSMEVDATGELCMDYSGSGSEVHWDSIEPRNKKKPYECSECFKGYSAADLISLHEDEPEED